MPASSTSSRGRRGMPSGAPSGAPLVTRVPVAPDDRRHERERQLVDDPGGQGRREQGRPALAEHVPQAALGEGVERARQVDVVVAGDEHGILTEHRRARSSARQPAAAQVTSSPAPRPSRRRAQPLRHPARAADDDERRGAARAGSA